MSSACVRRSEGLRFWEVCLTAVRQVAGSHLERHLVSI